MHTISRVQASLSEVSHVSMVKLLSPTDVVQVEGTLERLPHRGGPWRETQTMGVARAVNDVPS